MSSISSSKNSIAFKIYSFFLFSDESSFFLYSRRLIMCGVLPDYQLSQTQYNSSVHSRRAGLDNLSISLGNRFDKSHVGFYRLLPSRTAERLFFEKIQRIRNSIHNPRNSALSSRCRNVLHHERTHQFKLR